LKPGFPHPQSRSAKSTERHVHKTDENAAIQGGVRRTPLGTTARFLGWVPGGPWIFPRIKLVSLGGVLWGAGPCDWPLFPVSMGFFFKKISMFEQMWFLVQRSRNTGQIFRGCQPIEKTIFLTFMQHRQYRRFAAVVYSHKSSFWGYYRQKIQNAPHPQPHPPRRCHVCRGGGWVPGPPPDFPAVAPPLIFLTPPC